VDGLKPGGEPEATGYSGAVGVFGGTFDPIHLVHLVLAEVAREALQLSRVVFVPARLSPLKANLPRATDAQRAIMVELAIAENPAFSLDRIELEREGPSYTVDTLEALSSSIGSGAGTRLRLLLGSDALESLPRWRNPERILELARPAFMERPGHALDKSRLEAALPGINGAIMRIPAPRLELSSTDLRRRIADGRSIRYQVPDSVREFIEVEHLYRVNAAADVRGAHQLPRPGGRPE